MHYYEVVPAAWLRPFVRCFWGLRMSDALPEPQRVLPDGCCELVIHCGDRFTQQLEGRTIAQPTTLFVGPSTRALSIAPGRRVDVVAIRFQPGGAALLVSAPMATLRDAVTALDEIGVFLGLDIIDALAPLTDAERVALLERVLLRRLERFAPDRATTHAQQTIVRRGGLLRIDQLARETGLSLRQLQRRFQQQVGLTPKELARLVRLQRALVVASRPNATYGRIAAEAGYADHAHFTREFTAIAGISPRQYFAGVHDLNDLFSGPGTTF